MMPASNNTTNNGHLSTPSKTPNQNSQSSQKLENFQFLKLYPEVLNDVGGSFCESLQFNQWLKDVLDHVIPQEDWRLATLLTSTFKALKPGHSQEELKEARFLGWALQMQQSSINMLRDIMEDRAERQGIPTWHTLPSVGTTAINDAYFLETVASTLLLNHFGNLACYPDLLCLVQDSHYEVTIGQNLRTLKTKDPASFSLKEYEELTWLEFTQRELFVPLLVVLILLGRNDLETVDRLKDALTTIGLKIRLEQDFESLYEENKSPQSYNPLTWFLAKGLEVPTIDSKRSLLDTTQNGDTDKLRGILTNLGVTDSFQAFKAEVDQRTGEKLSLLPHDLKSFISQRFQL